jgi:hypothetical protein
VEKAKKKLQISLARGERLKVGLDKENAKIADQRKKLGLSRVPMVPKDDGRLSDGKEMSKKEKKAKMAKKRKEEIGPVSIANYSGPIFITLLINAISDGGIGRFLLICVFAYACIGIIVYVFLRERESRESEEVEFNYQQEVE